MASTQRSIARGLLLSFAVLASALSQSASAQGPSAAPQAYQGSDATYLAQGWNRQNTSWWYHVSQGTVFMPAEWFLALQQASGTAPFASPDHLARLGFIPDPVSEANPLGLPVGFATRALDFPDTDMQHYQVWKGQWVGFTCAACHTGQLTYNGQRIRLEGGPAHLDIEAFGDELAAALTATATSEPRFQRFAALVRARGANVTPEELRGPFNLFLRDQAVRNSVFEAGAMLTPGLPVRSGPGRLDAVHRGGNLLLSGPLGEPRNYAPALAPVRFPMLWDTAYFDWVLYNASIRQPMARNIVEDLGVGAPIDPRTFLQGTVRHEVKLDNLVEVHRVLKQLESPQWPEAILGRIDRAAAERGRVIFEQACAACHQTINRRTHAVQSRSQPADSQPGGQITIPIVPLETVGTDPNQARTFATRVVNLEKIGGPAQIPYMKAAETVVGRVVEQWAQLSPENAKLEQEINQGAPNEFRGPLAYRARPLNGLWSSPPFLHNGSVPSMYELLQPAARRSPIFYVGAWEYDPRRMGLVVGSPFPGSFAFDTRLPGNSNAGHEYGTDLSDPERMALIEYLKTL